MINKEKIKIIVIPSIIGIVVLIIILIIPLSAKKSPSLPGVAIPTTFLLPSSIPPKVPTTIPTLIPPAPFTGADLTQDIPPEVQLMSQQKMELRRKTPLELPFGSLTFSYEDDIFIVILKEPKDQSQKAFDLWHTQTYSAIPRDQFAIQ
jgi:hypothetical protein